MKFVSRWERCRGVGDVAIVAGLKESERVTVITIGGAGQ